LSFVTRAVRFRRGGKALDEIEESGNPEAIAASLVDIAPEEERNLIRAPRASSLYDACIRMHVIGTKERYKRYQRVNFKGRLTYGIGGAVHYWIQNTPDVFGDRRYGWWKCLACGTVRFFGGPPKRKCSCGANAKASEYKEHYLEVDENGMIVTGHPDMFLLRKKHRVTEIKTITGNAFPSLKAPMIAHMWQIQTYMWAANKCKNMPVEIDDEVGYVLYISKMEHSDLFPMKMFPVQKDPHLIGRIKAKLILYKKGIASYPKNLPPKHRECERNKGCWRANTCPCKKICFSK